MTTYWLDIFTAETWAELESYGFKVSGFRATRQPFARKIAPGDILLCYLAGGTARWSGALRVMSELYISETPRVWQSDTYPVRFTTEPIVTLTLETAVPVKELAPQLRMFRELGDPRNFGYMFQGSPRKLPHQSDGPIIVDSLLKAQQNPIARPIPVKGARSPQGTRNNGRAGEAPEEVVVPEPEPLTASDERTHSEIQYKLLKLGNDLGLDVWVARNDRGRSWNGHRFQDIERLRTALPEQFDRDTQRIVELIDVLWIERDGIRCAFEIENSTNIYGGLLRMSDLLARRPHLDIPLYIVAPDERFAKVKTELNRPTFSAMRKPLVEVCKFIPYDALRDSIKRWGDDIVAMRPEAIDRIARSCGKD